MIMCTDIYIYMFGRLLYSCSCALDCIGIILWDIVLYKCCKVITGEHSPKKRGCGDRSRYSAYDVNER